MRDILYKGIDIETREWVCGFYVCLNDKEHRIYSGYAETDCGDYYPDFSKIDPETLCEFTTLYNVAEKPIWEGDIVRFNDKNYVVQRENETLGGYWASTQYIMNEIGVCDYMSFVDTIDDYYNEICVEIIGNIHDNPELLDN